MTPLLAALYQHTLLQIRTALAGYGPVWLGEEEKDLNTEKLVRHKTSSRHGIQWRMSLFSCSLIRFR